jgi:hypothetical protein
MVFVVEIVRGFPLRCQKSSVRLQGKAGSWVYMDDEGTEQGPFPEADMEDWFKAGRPSCACA